MRTAHEDCSGDHVKVGVREDVVMVACSATGTTEEWPRCRFMRDDGEQCRAFTRGRYQTCFYHRNAGRAS